MHTWVHTNTGNLCDYLLIVMWIRVSLLLLLLLLKKLLSVEAFLRTEIQIYVLNIELAISMSHWRESWDKRSFNLPTLALKAIASHSAFFPWIDIGLPEQAVGLFSLGVGLAVEAYTIATHNFHIL